MSFFGRDLELRTLELEERPLQLVLGPVGIGKTALAREWARRGQGTLVAAPEAGRWLVAVAERLGIAANGARALAFAVGQRELQRLALDGVEAVDAPLGELLAELRERVPTLAVVLTSRQSDVAMALEAPELLQLEGLPLPRDGSELHVAPAAQLFVAAAERARGGEPLPPSEAPFVLELLRLLEGRPLALELTAARLAVMGPRALLHRLRGASSVAMSGAPTDRLRLALDASLRALRPATRTTFARCAVFAERFQLEAAEAIAGEPGVDLATQLAELTRASLLRHHSSPDGTVWLSLAPAERAEALGLLESQGERERLAELHARYFVAQGTRDAEALAVPATWAQGRARLLAMRAELRAIVRRRLGRVPLARGDAELAIAAAQLLSTLGSATAWGDLGELADALVVATERSGVDPRSRAALLLLRAECSLERRDARPALRDLAEAQHLAWLMQDQRLIARARAALGRALVLDGQAPLARVELEAAVALLGALGDRHAVAIAERTLATALAASGELQGAIVLFERAVAGLRREGDREALAEALVELGRAALDAELARAPAWLDEAAVVFEELGQRGRALLARALNGSDDDARAGERELARVGRTAEAAECALIVAAAELERGALAEGWVTLAAAAEHGDGPLGTVATLLLAELAEQQGRPDEAEGKRREGERRAAKANDPGLRWWLEARDGGHDAPTALLRRLHRASRGAQQNPAGARATLVIGKGGEWFQLGSGPRVSLAHRPQLIRLLAALLAARLASSEPAPSSSLVAAVWPGERMLEQAASQRLRVAVATLRKLGLREALETAPGGYRLTPLLPALAV